MFNHTLKGFAFTSDTKFIIFRYWRTCAEFYNAEFYNYEKALGLRPCLRYSDARSAGILHDHPITGRRLP